MGLGGLTHSNGSVMIKVRSKMFPEFPLPHTLKDGEYISHTRSSCVVLGSTVYTLHNKYGHHIGLYRINVNGVIAYASIMGEGSEFQPVPTHQDLFS